MHLIYDFPHGEGPDADMFAGGTVAEVAMALEAAGWDAISFTEHPAPPSAWLTGGGHQSVDPLIALSHAAAVTTRLRLLTYLVVAPYRNPLLLAKAAATVDVLSGGRLILGLGTGYLKPEFRALGVDFDARNTAFDEALDVLPLHWSGEPFDYEGHDFTARQVIGRPAAVQQPIPIWIGGNAKVTRDRVARSAQGWMPLVAPPEVVAVTRTSALGDLDDVAAKITAIKEQAGPRGDDLDVLYIYLDPAFHADPTADVERHRDAMAHLEAIGVTRLAIAGPAGSGPSETAEWIAAVGELYRT